LQPVTESVPMAGDGRLKRVMFARSPLMSSYLVAFAVGDFKHVEARTENGCIVRIYAPTNQVMTDGHFALDCAVKALNYYDKLYLLTIEPEPSYSLSYTILHFLCKAY
jgi:aminopeptidase N